MVAFLDIYTYIIYIYAYIAYSAVATYEINIFRPSEADSFMAEANSLRDLG